AEKWVVPSTQAAEEPKVQVQSSPVPRDSRPALSFASVVKKVAPSVVTIYSTKMVRENQRNPLLNDPFLRRFFGLEEEDGSNGGSGSSSGSSSGTRRPRIRQEQSLGSGVIVSPEGY